MRRRTILAAIGVVMTVTAYLAGPALADGKPITPAAQPSTPVPGGYASWADLYAVQAELDEAAAAISAADKENNASIVVSAADRRVRVYWPGVVPAAVRDAATASVTFTPARFGHAQLADEARTIASAGNGVVSAAPNADGSGVTVTVSAAPDQAAQNLLAGMSHVPLTIKVGKGVQAMVGRQADTPPFWGGARYNTPQGGCTNGFSLKHPQGNFYSITAAHCGTENGPVTIPGQPSPTGYSFAVLPCRDTMALGFAAGVAARIYTGPFNSSTSAHVAGAVPDFVGDYIATGGASSGEHVNIPVQAVNVFTPVGGIACATVGPLTQAGLPGNQCVVAPGDSGGPAYSYLTGSDVLGRGTITAGNLGTANCPGVSPIGANTVFYAPLLRPPGDPQVGSLQFGGVDILT